MQKERERILDLGILLLQGNGCVRRQGQGRRVFYGCLKRPPDQLPRAPFYARPRPSQWHARERERDPHRDNTRQGLNTPPSPSFTRPFHCCLIFRARTHYATLMAAPLYSIKFRARDSYNNFPGWAAFSSFAPRSLLQSTDPHTYLTVGCWLACLLAENLEAGSPSPRPSVYSPSSEKHNGRTRHDPPLPPLSPSRPPTP